MSRATFADLLAHEKPLVLPGAYDALSARLIEQAGFPALVIGGFSVVGARYGVPDIGLLALGEISAGVRDILAATRLPALVDADTGYGDVKNVVHSVRTYERLGAAALILEDQVSPKRCGHMAGKEVVPIEAMAAKIRAAAGGRDDPNTFLVARTDARAPLGLDEAIRRGERYLEAGADGVFVEAPESVDELERVGRAFAGVPNLANILAGGVTPALTPADLADMGFDIVLYGIDLILGAAKSVQETLATIKDDPLGLGDRGLGFEAFKEAVGFADWAALEERFGDPDES
jgi:2-methylisocitrate lyase-like PEP mutase family enzyme